MSGCFQEYVMVQRDSLYWLVGPFPAQKDAAEWGRRTYSLDDDPRWQTISLTNVSSPPFVVAPGFIGPAELEGATADGPGAPLPEELVVKRALQELARARAKFPKQDVWVTLAALTEEVGELNKEILHLHFEPDKGATWAHAYKEALQVIAVAMRIVLDSAPSEPLTVEPRS